MINRPQTSATETVDALNALIAESDRFRDREAADIQTLSRAIEKLQKVDARDAFVRFGALAAICGDVDGVLEYLRKALLHPNVEETKHEFWTSLGNVALYGKAQELGTWLLDPKRGFFPKSWPLAVSMGQVLEVWNRLPEAKKTFPELSEVDFSIVENAVAVMKAHRLKDQDIISVLDLMGEIQRNHEIMFSGKSVSILRVMRPSEDPAYLYFTIQLKADVTEIHAMNRELARLVVNKFPEGAFPLGIAASFAKAPPVELRVAA
jgi:hypothetical protein